jgi:hypothetical protein
MNNLRTIPIPRPKGGWKGDGLYHGDPCIVCGRDIMKPQTWVHVINGGDEILHKDDEDKYQDDGGDLGLQSVGAGCAKLIPKEYKHESR